MPITRETEVYAVAHFLEERGIPHELAAHPAAYTAGAEAAAAGLAGMAVKTIVLRDRYRSLLVVIPAHRHVDVARVRDLVGATRHLRLATEDEMARDLPLYEVGAVPPLGPRLPRTEIVDVRLLDAERVVCAAGDHRHSVALAPRDLLRAVEPRVADVCVVRDDIEDW